MSRSELERLVADVKIDKDIQNQMKSVHPSNKNVVEWANAHGYDITLDELGEYIREKKGELTDEQLEKVVGGKGLSYDWTVTNEQGSRRTFTPEQLAAIGHDMFIAHPVVGRVSEDWPADKEMVQDDPSEALLDAATSGASVETDGWYTNVTFADGVSVYENQAVTTWEGYTRVTLPNDTVIGHDYSYGSDGQHESVNTEVYVAYSGKDVQVSPEGGGYFDVIGTHGGNELLHVTKIADSFDATVATGHDSTDYQLTPQDIARAWARNPEAPAAWSDPAAQITVQSSAGGTLEHSDESGPETTITSASGIDFILPHTPASDWTVTNSQGDYRTFTSEEIYHGEVNWLVAHPKVDHIPDDIATAKEIADAWPTEKTTTLEDWNAEKASAVERAKDPAVQAWESAFDTAKAAGGGTLPHGATLQVASYSDGVIDYEIVTPEGRSVHWGSQHDGFSVWGPYQPDGNDRGYFSHNSGVASEDSPTWSLDTRSGVDVVLGLPYGSYSADVVSKGGAGLVYEASNTQAPWSIQTDWQYGGFGVDPAARMVSWGPGEVSLQSPDVNASLQVQDGHIETVESEKVYIVPGSGDNFLAGPAEQFSIETSSNDSVPTLLVTSPYGEQWTIAQGDEPIEPQSTEKNLVEKALPAAASENDTSIEQQWYVSNSSGQVVGEYNSEQFRQDAENAETTHPQTAQEIKTWTTDTETYEAAKQMWPSHRVDPQGLPDGTVTGSKGDVSYTFTASTSGLSGYELEIKGPDAYFHTEPVDYGSTPSRWVDYEKVGTGKSVLAVYSNGQVENLEVGDFSFVRQEGSYYGQVSGTKGDYLYDTEYGSHDQPLDTQVVLPDGADVTLTRDTTIQGPRGGFVNRREVPDADPIVDVQLGDETSISWQRSDEPYYKSPSALWEANLDFFAVSGAEGQELDWTPGEMTYHSDQTGASVSETPSGAADWYTVSYQGGMQDGTAYAPSLDSTPLSFQAPHGTVEVVPEWGYYRPFGPYVTGLTDNGNQVDYFKNNTELVVPLHPTDEEIVEFNDGLTLVHQPHFTEVYKGTYDQGQMVAESGQPVELLWVDGSLDQIAGEQIRPQGAFSKEAFDGRAVETIVPAASSSTGTLQESYTGVDGNVVTITRDSSGGSTATVDGAQLQRGQNETIMGPDGPISVEWDVASRYLPDGSDLSGSTPGFAVLGVHRDVQIVPTEQDGHSAWAIDDQRIISPYQYASKYLTEIQSKASSDPGWNNISLYVEVNEAATIDTTAAVQSEAAVETVVVAFALLVLS